MTRHLGLVLLAALAPACEPGEQYCWWEGCDDPPYGEASEPTPPDTLWLDYDLGRYHHRDEGIVVDGLFHFAVHTNLSSAPRIYEETDVFSFEITSSNNATVEVDVFGERVGTGGIFAQLPDQPIESLPLSVRNLSQIAVAFDDLVDASDRVRILSDVRRLALVPMSSDDEPLIDHSLALDSTSAPGFTVSPWDTLNVTAGLGTHRVVVTNASGELHEVTVEVVDGIDDILADSVPTGQPFGVLCGRAELSGEEVHTTRWQFTGTNVHLVPAGNACIAYEYAEPGSSITAAVGEVSKTFTVIE